MELAEALLNPFVIAYLAIIILGQIALMMRRKKRRATIAERRKAAGLPEPLFVGAHQKLGEIRTEAITDAVVLLLTVVVTPFILWLIALGWVPDAQAGLGAVFAGLLVWFLVSGTDVLKGFLGGLAFRTLVAVRQPFQVGDRVTLMGYSGKVTRIGPFHVTLNTSEDDLVTLPSAALWSEPLVSANAGERGSLSVMRFYLAPFASAEQRQGAEDCIWDAIQASSYYDFTKPMQIFLEQTDSAIQLTAKAYVARTYDEPLFKSDITRAFLQYADKVKLPLGNGSYDLSNV